jgi:uncharacterized repeat protein (TIGR03803 family)
MPNCSDGATPAAGLITDNPSASDDDGPFNAHLFIDKHGALYSTTFYGGGASNSGTVFKLTPPPKGQTDWIETVLYNFAGRPSDGDNPSSGLIIDKRGVLYGTTGGGGVGTPGGGVVFKLAPSDQYQTDWTETVLYNFCSLPNCSDGTGPARLLADKHRGLISTTSGGGAAGMAQFSSWTCRIGASSQTPTVSARNRTLSKSLYDSRMFASAAHRGASVFDDRYKIGVWRAG